MDIYKLLSIYVSIYLSISLSLSTYVYIYMFVIARIQITSSRSLRRLGGCEFKAVPWEAMLAIGTGLSVDCLDDQLGKPKRRAPKP